VNSLTGEPLKRESTKATGALMNYIKESCKHTFNRYRKNANTSLFDLDDKEEEVLFGEMSTIVLWGATATIILKLHFNLNTASYYASHEIKEMNDETINMCRDFMKEFSNMQAGHIRGFFEEHKVFFGMSLPFLGLGIDEPIFKRLRGEIETIYKWKLVDENNNSFVCSAEVTLNNQEAFLTLQNEMKADIEKYNSADSAEEEGDVMFL
jgi:CheY-specific phosphatase CheX